MLRPLTIAAAVGMLAAAVPGGAAQAMDTAMYTTVQFQNAPEGIMRVLSWTRQGDGLLLTALARPCGEPPGAPYRALVRGANASTFHRGDFLLTGMVHGANGAYWAVRHLTPAEASALGACAHKPL